MTQFTGNDWEDMGTYWLNKNIQGSGEWLKIRERRVTASRFYLAAGIKLYDMTQEQYAMYIKGEYTEKVSNFSKYIMEKGVINEPKARKLYEKISKCKVNEVGIAIPKWNQKIGASVDGIVENQNGIIEIKCPFKMYPKILEYVKDLQNGVEFDEHYHGHIKIDHYYQMQGCMHILGKEWCDYVIYDYKSNKIYIFRVWYNNEFCDKELFPNIEKFIKKYKI